MDTGFNFLELLLDLSYGEKHWLSPFIKGLGSLNSSFVSYLLAPPRTALGALFYQAKNSSSNIAHKMWKIGRWRSWMPGVFSAGTQMQTSHNGFNSPPVGPVKPTVCRPSARASR